MKISFKPLEGPSIPCSMPYDGATFVRLAHAHQCPACKSIHLTVRGAEEPRHDHDTYYSFVLCNSGCGAKMGELRAQVSTIFGIEEDERMLRGRCRVY